MPVGTLFALSLSGFVFSSFLFSIESSAVLYRLLIRSPPSPPSSCPHGETLNSFRFFPFFVIFIKISLKATYSIWEFFCFVFLGEEGGKSPPHQLLDLFDEFFLWVRTCCLVLSVVSCLPHTALLLLLSALVCFFFSQRPLRDWRFFVRPLRMYWESI